MSLEWRIPFSASTKIAHLIDTSRKVSKRLCKPDLMVTVALAEPPQEALCQQCTKIAAKKKWRIK